jgi:hypothetical protein
MTMISPQTSADPMSAALKAVLNEFGLTLLGDDAAAALGRLAGLELASSLGLRPARRVLAHERSTLLKNCFYAVRFDDFDPPPTRRSATA